MEANLKRLLDDKGGEVYTVPPQATLIECVEIMKKNQVGALVVADEDGLQGIFTERDILLKVAEERLDLTLTPVSTVMSTEVAVVSPELTVSEAMSVCTERRHRHLPVVAEGKLLGVISTGDIAHWLVREKEDEIQQLVRYISGGY